MELRQIRYFLAVAEELHFTRAADKLHVAQPALSQQIRQLEEEIGAKLLERSNRRVVLTPAGEIFRTRSLVALDQISRAGAEAGQVGRGEAGTVSIGFVSSAVWGVLPALLRRLRQSAPLASIELRELEPSEQLRDIRQQHLDVGMLHASLNDPELSSIVIARDQLIAALPEKHEAGSQECVDLKTLSGETFIVPKSHASVGFRELVLAACAAAGFSPARMQSTRLLQTAVALVAGGVGVALVPESFRENLQIRGVVYRSLNEKTPVAELVAVWRTDNQDPLLLKVEAELKAVIYSPQSYALLRKAAPEPI
jgi:DNA-binding transcriptional LysR family regulator